MAGASTDAPFLEQEPDALAPKGTATGLQAPPKAPPAPQQKLGFLLDEQDEGKVVQHVENVLWKPWDGRLASLEAAWRANKLTRAGTPGVRVIEDTDTRTARVWVPPGATAQRVGLPKTDQLVRKTVDTLLVDPPLPEATPSSDDDEARAAAELATRLLRDDAGPQAGNLRAELRAAMDLAGTYGSGFLWTIVDPTKGGWVPMEVLAHPLAQRYDEADPEGVLDAPAPVTPPAMPPEMLGAPGAPGMPGMDPAAPADPMAATGDAGMPGAPPMAPPAPADPAADPSAVELVKRFVMPDGALSKSAVGARMVWRPGLVTKRLNGKQLRFVPETATGIDDALGVVITTVMSLGEVASMFPRTDDEGQERELTLEEQTALVEWRPVDLKKVLPQGMKVEGEGKPKGGDGQFLDHALVMLMVVYLRSHGRYPKGAYVVVGGGTGGNGRDGAKGMVLHRQPWSAVMEGAEELDDAKASAGGAPRLFGIRPEEHDVLTREGLAREECLDLPIAQFRWYEDSEGGNPYGESGVPKLAPGDDLRHMQMAALVDFLWRFNNPNVFIPYTSMVQPGMLARRDGTPIPYNPSGGGKPEYEQFPAFPGEAMALYAGVGTEMDAESGLMETAQGVDSGNAKSGVAKQTVIEQALVALSGVKGNLEDGFLRHCRIRLQLMRAFFTGAQLLSYSGDDGGYRVREWSRAELRSTRSVRIARGTSTMLTRSAKQALATEQLTVGLQAQDPQAYPRFLRATSSLVDPTLGLEDDPHRLRVRRQLSQWREGPPKDAPAPMLAPPPMSGAPGMAPGVPMDPAAAAAGAPATPPELGASQEGLQAAGTPTDPAAPAAAPPPPPVDLRAQAIFAPTPADAVPWIAMVRLEEVAREMAGAKYERYRLESPEWAAALDEAHEIARQNAGVATIAEQQQAAQQQAQMEAESRAQELGAKQADGEAARADARAEKHADREHRSAEAQADREAGSQREAQQHTAQQQADQLKASVQAGSILANLTGRREQAASRGAP